MSVQVVLHPGEPLSPNDQGESLPTTVHLYQLKTPEPIGKVTLDQLLADAKAALGESFIAEESFVVWPKKDEVRAVQPKGDAQQILLVAEFRRLLGTGWYQSYDVPERALHEAAYCTAEKRRRKDRRKKALGQPCFFVTLEQYTVHGSPSSAGFDGPRPECAPPPWMYEIDNHERRRAERKERRRRRGGGLPRRPPSAPKVPNLPKDPAGAAPANPIR